MHVQAAQRAIAKQIDSGIAPIKDDTFGRAQTIDAFWRCFVKDQAAGRHVSRYSFDSQSSTDDTSETETPQAIASLASSFVKGHSGQVESILDQEELPMEMACGLVTAALSEEIHEEGAD